jgi:hypothetical protein
MAKIPSHRKRRRITLEEFRAYKESGIGIKEMPKRIGGSKNQIQFLSALDQGKFDHIDPDEFRSDYMSGMKLADVCKKYGVSFDYKGFMREHLGIPRMGAKFIKRKQTEKPLSDYEKQIIRGSLLGDAGKMSSSSVKMKQSIKQKQYLLWKFAQLHTHVRASAFKEESQYDKRYDKRYEFLRFYTRANTDIETILTEYYPDGQKRVTRQILDKLEPIAIAVWYMDDGSTDFNKRTHENSRPSASLCTDSFSKEECELIARWFQERWGIAAYVRPRSNGRKTYLRVCFGTDATERLFALIRPYVIPSMMYKVNLVT